LNGDATMTTTIAESRTPTLAELATEINDLHRRAESAMRSGLEHALAAGQLLIEAKAQCQHGDWGQWLANSFEGSERTARAYMQLAKRWPEIESKTAEPADLSIDGALKMLAAPSEPNADRTTSPPPWSIRETNRRVAHRMAIQASIGTLLTWAVENGVRNEHKLSRWLCPAQGWMNEDRQLDMVTALAMGNAPAWPGEPRKSMEMVLTEAVCYHAGIKPIRKDNFSVVCMCDLAIGISKFASGRAPGDGPHRVAPCEQYGQACVFSCCISEADRRRAAKRAEECINGDGPATFFDG